MKFRPYKDKRLNNFQLFSLITMAAIVLTGTFICLSKVIKNILLNKIAGKNYASLSFFSAAISVILTATFYLLAFLCFFKGRIFKNRKNVNLGKKGNKEKCSSSAKPNIRVEITNTRRTEAPLDSQERFTTYNQRKESTTKNNASFESSVPEEFKASANDEENNNRDINPIQEFVSLNSQFLSEEALSPCVNSIEPYLRSYRFLS